MKEGNSEESERSQCRNKRKSTSAISRNGSAVKKRTSSEVPKREPIESPQLMEHHTSVNSDFISTDHCYARSTENVEECEDIVKYPANSQNTACQSDLTLDMINTLET